MSLVFIVDYNSSISTHVCMGIVADGDWYVHIIGRSHFVSCLYPNATRTGPADGKWCVHIYTLPSVEHDRSSACNVPTYPIEW